MKTSGIMKLTVVAVIIVCAVIIITNRINSNALADRKAELEASVARQREVVAGMQHRYDTPFDKDFIIRLAKEKLNLVMPDVTVYHTDISQ